MKHSRNFLKDSFRTTKDFKGAAAIDELRRAHVIIVLLSLSLTFLLIAASSALELNQTLVIVIAVLLILNSLISAGIAVALRKK